MNRKYSLVVFVVVLAVALTLSAGGVIAQEQGPQSPQIYPASSTAAMNDEPVEIWSISWTSTMVASGETYPEVRNYNYTQSGSTLYRVYADGAYDNTNSKLFVADEAHATSTTECGRNRHAISHYDQSNAEPARYNNNNTLLWRVSPFYFDGQWKADFLTPDFYASNHFPVKVHEYGSDCEGQTWDTSRTHDSSWSTGCFDLLLLQGNAQGNEFTYHWKGSGVWDTSVGYYVCKGPSAYVYSGDQVQWSVDVTARLLGARDLTVKRLEVTQGLQDEANSIPLVQGRRTVVRAFLDIGTDPGPVNGVTGLLEGYAGDTLLGTVSPFNPNGRINAPSDPDWKNIDDTLNFELPYVWTLQPSLRLTVKINPDQSVMESNYENNELSADVSTRACHGISIGYTPIYYEPDGHAPTEPSINIKVGDQFMQRIFPVSELGLIYEPRGARVLLQDVNLQGTPESLVSSLEDVLLISSLPRPNHIYGWLPSMAFGRNGAARTPGVAAFGNDTETPDRWRRTFAHEVGHNLGLLHPEPDLTTNGAHWFDVYDRVIKPVPAGVSGDQLLDFMVPERLESEAWISPTNYKYLIGKMCSATSATTSTGFGPSQGGDNLIVSGIISNTTPAGGTLKPLFRLSTVPTSTLPNGSQYCVNLKDASENLLSNYCFDQSFDGDSETPTDATVFSMVIPYPAELARVELTEGATGSVLSLQAASAHAPSVTVTFPYTAGLTLSGDQTITWAGSDTDSDPLTYDVLYSRDNGTTWIGVGAQITGTSYSLDFSKLPGTDGASGLIKIMVSDSFYSAQDISTHSFTVGNKPPVATIMSPSSGALFYTGPQIVLEGTGVDPEDSSLGVSSLSWGSSKDGALGTGQLLEANLSSGAHTITLTVTDSKGLNDTASIAVMVVQSTSKSYLFLPLIIR